jgi:predicted permease
VFSVITGLAFGVIPAIYASRRATSGVLRSGRFGRPRQVSRVLLVAVEIAASVVLLVSGGLLLRAMLRVQAVESGIRSEGVLLLRTVPTRLRYPSVASREQFYRSVLGEVRQLPGVQSAAYTNGLPMVVTGLITRVVVPGQEVRRDEDYSVSRRFVTPQFFSALGIPILRGRDLQETDGLDGRRVAVVSESFALRYWPGQDAIGRVFTYQNATRTVVGVVRDIKVRGLERVSEPQLYMPSPDVPDTPLTAFDPKDLVVRSTVPHAALLPAVREIIHRVDPEQPISDVMTGADLVDSQTAARRAQVRILVVLAAVASLVAGIGIYGTLAYAVAQRRHEIGLRLALGAQPARIARGVVRDGIAIVGLGLIPGLLVAYGAARYMSSLLFGVQPADPVTIAVTVTVCGAVSLCGALLPALRAVQVSPMSVLRSE